MQGIGAATVMVVPRAIIRDLHTRAGGDAADGDGDAGDLGLADAGAAGRQRADGGRQLAADLRRCWRLAGLLSLALTAFVLPETLAPANRTPARPAVLARSAGRLLRDPAFMGLTLIGGFAMSSFFVFIASASFVYTEQFGLSPTGFSLAFALNAIGFFAASQMAASLGERFGMARVVGTAVTAFAVVTTALLPRRARRACDAAGDHRHALRGERLPRAW